MKRIVQRQESTNITVINTNPLCPILKSYMFLKTLDTDLLKFLSDNSSLYLNNSCIPDLDVQDAGHEKDPNLWRVSER